MTDPSGQVWQFTFNSNGDMTNVVNPSGTTATIGYDGSHRVTSYSNGVSTWTYSYNFADNSSGPGTTTATDPLFNQKFVSHLKKPGPASSVTDELNRTTSYSYDSYDRPTTISYPEGNSASYTYTPATGTAPGGNTSDVRQIAKPGSGLGDINVHADYPLACDVNNLRTCNKATSITDGRGFVTSYFYNSNGSVLTETLPAVSVGGSSVQPQRRYAYTSLNGIEALASTSTCRTSASCTGTADESVTSTSYGSAAQNYLPVTITAGSGATPALTSTTLGYDNFGNTVTTQDALGNVTYSFYDASRRLTGRISADPDGGGILLRRAMRMTYRPDGQVSRIDQGTATGTSATDLANMSVLQSQVMAYDSIGRPVQQRAEAGGTAYAIVQSGYDALSRQDCVAQRMNPAVFGSLPASACDQGAAGSFGPDRIVRNSYDAASELQTVTTGYGTPLQRNEINYTYTPNGRVQTIADAKNNLTTYTYDGFDRQAQTRYPNASGGGSSSSDYEELGYDANANVTTRRIRNGTIIAYSYDALNRLSSKSLPTGTSNANPAFGYDLVGNMLTANNGNPSYSTGISFVWDALGRKVQETSTYNGAGSATKSVQYDANGRRTRLTWPDGLYVTYDYNNVGEMTAIRENGSFVLASYGYNDLGLRAFRSLGNGTSTSYAYDPISRLTGLSLAGASATNINLANYSPAGEIGLRTLSNDAYAWTQGPIGNTSYTSDGRNQYSQVNGGTVGYDPKGNLTSIGGNSYTFNAENALASGGGSTFRFDSLQRLTYSTSTSLRFDYDDSRLTTLYNASNALVRRYVHGPTVDEPVVWYEGTGTADRRYMDADERGSIIRVTNNAGALQRINTYDEYGLPASTNLGRFQYTGQVYLSEVGVYNYKARIYSPSLGRLMQPDPIGYEGGINLYAYVGNDPANLTDPSGLQYGPSASVDLGLTREACIYCNATSYAPPGGDILVVANQPSGYRPVIGDRAYGASLGNSLVVPYRIGASRQPTVSAAEIEYFLRAESGPRQPSFCASTTYQLADAADSVGTYILAAGVVGRSALRAVNNYTPGFTRPITQRLSSISTVAILGGGALSFTGQLTKTLISRQSGLQSLNASASFALGLTAAKILRSEGIGLASGLAISKYVDSNTPDPCG